MPVEEVKDDKSLKGDVLWCTEVERYQLIVEYFI